MTIHHGSCHCGAVQFEVDTPVTPAVRCNCSLCRRKGALMSPFFPANALRITAGEDSLTLYQFNTRVAKHYFCKVCGIYTFHRPRVAPELYGVNVSCLEGVDALALEVGLNDGAAYSVV